MDDFIVCDWILFFLFCILVFSVGSFFYFDGIFVVRKIVRDVFCNVFWWYIKVVVSIGVKIVLGIVIMSINWGVMLL